MGKRSVRVLLALVFALLLPGSPAWAGDGAPVSMEVSAVYGDMGKFGSHIPLVVTLYGQSEAPFNGTVSVKTLESGSDGGDEVYQYSFPVSVKLAETENKEIYVPLGQKSSGIYVALCDEKGKELDSRFLSFDVSRDMGRLVIGALTDNGGELSYLDGVHLEYGMVDSRLLLLDQKLLPSDARGLELLDILLVNGCRTEALSEDQRTAVFEWVDRGGTLLLGTGPEAEEELKGLLEELDGVKILGCEKKNVGLGVEYAQDSPEDARVDLACTELSVPGGKVVMEGDGTPLLTVSSRGKGKIGFFSYNLGEIQEFAEKNPGYAVELLRPERRLLERPESGEHRQRGPASKTSHLYGRGIGLYLSGGAGAVSVSEEKGSEPVLRRFCGGCLSSGLGRHLPAGNGYPLYVGILYAGHGAGRFRGYGGGNHIFRHPDTGQPALFPPCACGV